MRKGGKGDHNFSEEDLRQQISYLGKMNINDDKWILFIRTDSAMNVPIPQEYQNNIFSLTARKKRPIMGWFYNIHV